MQVHRNEDRWHRSNNNITTQINKQANKNRQINQQTSKQTTETDYATIKCVYIYTGLIQGNEMSLIKFALVSEKTWKTVKGLVEIL